MADETTSTPPLPAELPVLPLRRTVAFPLTLQPLAVNRPMSVESVNTALATDRLLLLILQKSDDDDPGPDQLESVGTVGIIRQMARGPQGLNIIVEGMARARVETASRTGNTVRARITALPEATERTVEVDAYVRRIQELVDKALSLTSGLSQEVKQVVASIEDPLRLVYLLATLIDAEPEQKQQLLSADPLEKKLELMHELLGREVEVLEVKGRIESQAQQEMTDAQRQYYLRQQLKAIQNELGEGEGNEIKEVRERVEKADLPDHIREVATREVDRLGRMTPASPDYQMIRTYLDWLLELPWKVATEDRLDPVEARRVLDEDHYDLDKVKERIVEYLAVRKLKGDMKGPILCFVGPPGVGKTSLGQSIARAMQRKFVRISLGGVRDEAEIRGHRRTYIGSMPGKVIQSMKKVKHTNPLFLLDEIDKMGSDFRGDPSAALLEVLDPEQNGTFADHYLEVDYDLSDVMFVTTSNTLNIPGPLMDRMEIIRLAGYTEDEKVEIARRHLISKAIEGHGLRSNEWTIDDAALRQLVRVYTREAGVRNLERELNNLARKSVKEILTSDKKSITITLDNLEDYAGVPKYRFGEAEGEDQVGVVTGLAWTEVGGELLTIEGVMMPGKGRMTVTGNLRDVMKESISAANSYVRSRATRFGIEPPLFERKDIHVHVPEGATPKDGPSAGVAMATAIVSVMTGIAVRKDVAMTGEITLRGRVLPIGGLKEKLLAALRGGIKKVLIPQDNVKDLAEIPDNVKNGMEIVPVSNIDEVLRAALIRMPDPIEWDEEAYAAEQAARRRSEEAGGSSVTAH